MQLRGFSANGPVPGYEAERGEEACHVAYRIRNARIEFLISREGSSRWEFPQAAIAKGENPAEAACRSVRELAGLSCRLADRKALDEFTARQQGQPVLVRAFLVLAEDTDAAHSQKRVRWCLAEEARARIRRKPMRRLIDLALAREQAE